jgi:hypothetical protein
MTPRTVTDIVFLIIFFPFVVASALPSGFIAEVVTDRRAITGTFAPNPRKNHKPMLMLVSKEGVVSVVENPDDSPDSFVILNLAGKMCTNTERGLQSITIHPEFAKNRYVYLYYNKFKDGCLADKSDNGPYNVVARFVMDPETLLLAYETREEIWR